jgi:hypothetical protein
VWLSQDPAEKTQFFHAEAEDPMFLINVNLGVLVTSEECDRSRNPLWFLSLVYF